MKNTENMNQIPHIIRRDGKELLIVDGEPYIMLAGEVHNSAASSPSHMESVWEKAELLGMNTLLVPVTWELLEPEEDHFDFSNIDGLIAQARRRDMRLGILWFGAWKNAQCYYAPAWVKRDLDRFPRAQMEKGKNLVHRADLYGMPYTTLSYLGDETRKADAKAFSALMRHLRETDVEETTVITVQVENETGVMAAAREHSDEADALFADSVPKDFIEYMKAHTDTMVSDVQEAVEHGAASGTWESVFGEVAEEVFSAYHIAGYVGAVARAGKAEYALPMSANCWLDKGDQPGKYPSGGPVSRMAEVWRYRAPEIDILAPDIYVPDFLAICDEYTRRGGALYIPETATHSYSAPREVYAVGHYHAMCYSPFGFEEMGEAFGVQQGFLFGMDVEDPALKTPQDPEEYGTITRMLRSMLPLLTKKYGTSKLQAATAERPDESCMQFSSFAISASFDTPMLASRDGVCLVLQETVDTFYILVSRAALGWQSLDPARPNVDILAFEEGHFENGEWVRNRRLNGDEAVLTVYPKPILLRLQLLAYS